MDVLEDVKVELLHKNKISCTSLSGKLVRKHYMFK